MITKFLSRIIGIIWIISSLLWAAIGVTGLIFGFSWLQNIEIGLIENLTNVSDSLDSVHSLIVESTDIVSATHQSLETIQQSTHDVSNALADARPLLWTTTKVVTLDVPDALDGVQESMPSLIETAKSVDETLTWLSNFNFTIPNPFGTDWNYDLGIRYAPEVPLDQALEDMSGNLEGVPDDLRDMNDSLNAADANLVIVSDDLAILAGDLDIMNQQIADINPHLETLAGNIKNVQKSVLEIQESSSRSFQTARLLMSIILGLIVFTQIPSIFMGWLLVNGTISPSNSLVEDKDEIKN